jgi:hypothetical protein
MVSATRPYTPDENQSYLARISYPQTPQALVELIERDGFQEGMKEVIRGHLIKVPFENTFM